MTFMAMPASALPARFQVTELGSLGGDVIVPVDINNRGQIAGQGQDSYARVRVFRSRPGMRVEPRDQLPVPEGKDSAQAAAISENGTIVGYSRDEGRWTTPYYWPATGGVRQGAVAGRLMGINAAGDMVGETALSRDGVAVEVPFLIRRNGTTTQYNEVGGNSLATDINDFGVIVGTYRVSPGAAERAFKWTGSGAFVELGPLPITYSHGVAINAGGRWLVQGTDGGSNPRRTFVGGPADDRFVELSAPAGTLGPMGANMNDVDWVVGSVSKGGRWVAAFWHAGATPVEAAEVMPRLNGIRGELRGISAVNDEGVMVAVVYGGPSVVISPVRLGIGIEGEVFAGRAHTIVVRDCEPGSTVRLFKGTRRTANPLPDRSLGIRHDLQDGRPVGQAVTANASGEGTFSTVLSTAPGALLLQAVHRGNKSPALEVKIKPVTLIEAPRELVPTPKLPPNRKLPR